MQGKMGRYALLEPEEHTFAPPETTRAYQTKGREEESDD
jgi:hypothetical protein